MPKKLRTLNKTRKQPKIKTTRLRHKPKKKTIEIVSRRSQGRSFIRSAEVTALDKKASSGGMVSSSWIQEIYWLAERNWAHMVLQNGYSYNVYIPFMVYEQWFYAHSKGTFFNYIIKDKYDVVRTA